MTKLLGKKTISRWAITIAILFLLPSIQSPAYSAERLIKIAFQGPLSGPEADLGLSQLEAVKYIVKKFNQRAQGSLKIEIVEVDDKGDPAVAAQVAPLIANDSSIIGLIGPSYSGATRTSLPAYKASSLAMISPSATNPVLTDPTNASYGAPVFHRVILMDVQQAAALAKLAEEGLTNPRTLLITDEQIWPGFKDNFLAAGTPLIGTIDVSSTTTDYSALVAEVAARKATSVVLTGYFQSTSLIVAQLRKGGYTGRIAINDGSVVADFASRVGGTYAEGVVATAAFAPPAVLSKELQFDYKNTVGTPVPDLAVPALEAANIYINCISKGNITRSAILSCIKSYSGKSLVGEQISFDKNGDIVGATFPRLIVKNGQFVALTSSDLKPAESISTTQPQAPTVISFNFLKKVLEISFDISRGATPDNVYLQFPKISSKKFSGAIKGKVAKFSVPLTSSMFGKALDFKVVSARKKVESQAYSSSVEIPAQNSGAEVVATKIPSAPRDASYSRTEKGHAITVDIDSARVSRATDSFLFAPELGLKKASAVKGLTIGTRSLFKVNIPDSLIGKKIAISLFSTNSIGESVIYSTTITPESLTPSSSASSVTCQKASQIRTFEAASCPPGWIKR